VSKSRLRLQPDEQVILDMLPSAFWTALVYVVTFGLWAVWRSRHHFVLTNQRVLVCNGIVTKGEKSVPIARLQDVTLVRSLLSGGHVRMSSAGGTISVQQIGPLSRENARRFADAISTRIQHGGDGLGGVPPGTSLPARSFPPFPPSVPAQWAPDPLGEHDLRYWDGQRWTAYVASAPTTSQGV